MKNTFLLLLTTVLVFSCKKEIASFNPQDYLTRVKEELKDSVSAADYSSLDFGKSVLYRVDSVHLFCLRIPFYGKPFEKDFVIVKTDALGHISQGRTVGMDGGPLEYGIGTVKARKWNGSLTISTLKRTELLHSSVIDGYITALHQQPTQRTYLELAPDVLPEVVIIGIRHLDSGISFSTWCMVQTFFMDYGGGGGGSWGGFYGSLDGGGGPSGGGGGGGGGYNPGGNGPTNGETILIDVENQDEQTAIDMEKFINCFNAIPDAGATCSIEIMADIPVDNDPDKIFNFNTNSPGHTFINIRKKNATQSVSQNIGFYPRSGLKTILTNAPIDGKFVDNSNHEFNAGFTQNITPEQLQHVLIKMQRDKNMKYDIDNFNCTDWALDMFNAAGAFHLDVPLYDIPGNYPSSGTHMPNGVYNTIRQIKTSNPAQSANTDMDFLKAYSGTSTGPCN